MRTFDYSFLKNQIPGQIVSISNVISDLNAKVTMRRKQNPKAFDAMKQRAIVESVKGSNAIEGSQCIWKNLLFVINETSRPRWEGKPDEGQR